MGVRTLFPFFLSLSRRQRSSAQDATRKRANWCEGVVVCGIERTLFFPYITIAEGRILGAL